MLKRVHQLEQQVIFFTHLSVVYVCIFSLAVCAHALMVQANTLRLSYSEAPQAEIRGEEFVDRVLNQRRGEKQFT